MDVSITRLSRLLSLLLAVFSLWAGTARPLLAHAALRPNVLLVVMDDMGYGDLSCHGSPHVRTPHLDGLYASAMRLTDFHVAPMCSPTRGQLLTGLDAMRNGSTIVASSRMMVRADVPMAPALFAAAGYATGQFGKWHLGENHPHRPQDRGFQDCLWFPLQEISSLSDYWGNDYFDPVLRRGDGQPHQFTGYCTDIFFQEAIAWMQRQHQAEVPFLCYLPLNVCHGPQWAPRELREAIAREFRELSAGQIGYLAMLANADENVGRLEAFLAHTGLRENTVVVFLSDNGGYALVGRYNAGMRDGKSRLAEGGHRVPCFVRWPAGGIAGGRDVAGLTQVQDLLPTLLELCGVEAPAGTRFDGTSLAAPLRGQGDVPDRTLVVQYGVPQPFHMACVMRGRWRLLTDIKGLAAGEPELYNLAEDPLQKTNLIDTHPDMAHALRAAYDRWWAEVEPLTALRAATSLGHPDGGIVTLNCAQWRENALTSVVRLREGVKRRGVWDVEIIRDGMYEIALRRWPEEAGLALRAAAPAWTPRDTATPDHAGFPAGAALPIAGAQLRIGAEITTLPVAESDTAAVFRVQLHAGRTELEANFQDAAGKHLCPAYFVQVSVLSTRGNSQR
ncbi:MAG: arylsulfatase [Pirellulaceae bacterium]|nr:arylsulfatase [Pirellulaceae bacterium]